MKCLFGRKFDEKHPTCLSCSEQGEGCQAKRRKGKDRSVSRSGPVVIDGKKGWVAYCDLRTPNDWTGDPSGKIYRAERRKWKKALQNCIYQFGKAGGRRKLTVSRFVSDKRGFILDETNQHGSLKPLEDALKQAGVLVDDSPRWLERDRPGQFVGETRVEIILEDIN